MSDLSNKGFSVVELVVSIAIMGLILSIVFKNQSNFTEVATLKNDAETIATSLNQAQVYGISVREVKPGTNEFNAPYGIEFNRVGGSDSGYVLFADRGAPNGSYDNDWACIADPASECVEKINMTGSNKISTLCSLDAAGNQDCSVGRVGITYKRPEPTANFAFYNQSGVPISIPSSVGIRVGLQSQGGKTFSVYVYKTGQISVQ